MKSKYSESGGYGGYDKNNKERDALDYYSTPTEEVYNILNIIKPDFDKKDIILEPCAGGGHMVQGILKYLNNVDREETMVFATDVQQRELCIDYPVATGLKYDFLSNDYPYHADWIIMNPPYKTAEGFIRKALEITKKGVLMLCRLQFLEGKSRFENLYSINPPTDVFVYVDRIVCYKNGDTTLRPDGIQAYAWFYWDLKKKEKGNDDTQLHWLHRIAKK